MMAAKSDKSYRMEYRLVRGAGAFFNAMPYRCALGAAWVLGKLLYAIAGKRRREAARRVRLVFGDAIPGREVRRICWTSFRNTIFNAVEMVRIRKFGLDDMRKMIPAIDDHVHALNALLARTDGRGVLLALPHMGNWDLAGSACHLSGIPIFSVAGKQRNPYMNNFINEQRSGRGMDIIERGGRALRQIMVRIRRGEVFAILPDTRSFTPDLKVAFLGGEANLARGMASFALSLEVPVQPVIMRRIGWTRFEFDWHDPIWPSVENDREAELQRITESVMGIIDAAIRKTPEQWFWYNKRWVLDPVEDHHAEAAGEDAAIEAGPPDEGRR